MIGPVFSIEDIILFNDDHNIFMSKNKGKDSFAFQCSRASQNQNLKVVALKSGDMTLNKNSLAQKVLAFSCPQYPFLNTPKSQLKFYKTILNQALSQEQLKNVVAISHQNMIKIQKIAKGGGKVSAGKTGEVYYSIYYEVVAYSIMEIASSTKKFNSLLPNLTSLNLCQQLLAIIQYLIKENIKYQLKLEDIGITQAGQLKVFISPLLLIHSQNNSIDRKIAIDSVDKVLLWWKTTVAKGTQSRSLEAGNYYLCLLNSFSNDQTTAEQSKGNCTSFIQKQREKNDFQGQIRDNNLMHKSQTHQNNHLKNQRIKKLDKELKIIRQSLKLKGKHRIFKQKELKTAPLDSKDKQVQVNKSIEPQKPKKQSKPEEAKVQSIQQNIHCINIFHNPVPMVLNGMTKLHNNGVFHSFNKPGISRQMKEHKQVAKPHYVAFNNQIPDDLFHEEEDNLSIDTYQMDMGLDFQVAPNHSKNKIPLGNREREVSQCNYKVKREEDNKTRPGVNQVTNKSVTVSAGPKQFKNFVVNFVKPQFLAKKSNIYQDPGEYQSQNSKSISNKFSIQYKELNEAGKSVTSHTQKSSSLAKESMNRLQNNFVINEQSSKKIDQNKKYMKKAQIIHTESNDYSYQNKPIKPQKSETLIGSKKLQDMEIGKKVIEALEKTKNAIALLNKVKQAKHKNGN